MINSHAGNQSFWETALNALQVKLVYNRAPLAAVSATGPVILIANHPYGVLDGLAMCYLASRLRPNFRILLNASLCREERIAEHTLPIDFSVSVAATRTNIESKRKAIEVFAQRWRIADLPGSCHLHSYFTPWASDRYGVEAFYR